MLTHWIWLAELTGLQEQEKLALLQHFSDPEDLFEATQAELEALEWLTPPKRQLLSETREAGLQSAEEILRKCAQKDIHILTYSDSRYPGRLRHIPDPPILLYYKGQLPEFSDNLFLGVVGTRKASTYGLGIAKKLGRQIAGCGGRVVTGMALGIDTMAAAGALWAESPVVGVLGCGVDKVYPASNRQLFDRVLKTGCLISEYPPGTAPAAWNFPRRNRIISGICQGVVVVEAPEKSGALITARQAMEQGRDVFVVPGNVGVASCAGSNALLREGATLITCGWDAVSEYAAQFPDKLHREETPLLPELEPISMAAVAQSPQTFQTPEAFDEKSVDKSASGGYSGVSAAALTGEEGALLQRMPMGEQLLDDTIAASGLPAAQALAILTMLEIKGYTQTLPGKRIIRIM